jgi:hypothetical protein
VDAYRPGLPRPSTAYGTRPLALGCFPGGPAARSRHLPHSTGSNRSCCPSRRSESTPRRYLPSSATKTERSRPSEATQPRKGRVADRQPPRDERRATLRSLSVPASNFGMAKKRSPRTSTRCYSISKTPSPRVTPSLTRQTHRRRAV